MVTEEQVTTALKQVFVPTAEQSVIDLNLVRKITIADKNITVTLASTALADEVQNFVAAGVKSALQQFKNTVVQVDFVAAKPQELNEIKNIVAVMSGKGGVGKSTVAVNIAVALAQSGARVGLMDADIYGPNIPTMLGVEKLPPPNGNKLVPAVAYDVKMISMGLLVKPGQPLIWRGPMLNSAIRQFLADVEWGELDYLIVDLPPGTGDAALSLAQALPLSGAIIVTLPQLVSLEDASRGLQMFRTLEVPILGVIENMSYLDLPDGTRMDIFGSGGGEQLAQATQTPFLGKIPIDQNVRIGGDSGKPIVISHPDSPVAKALREIAESLAAKISVAALGGKNELPINIVE